MRAPLLAILLGLASVVAASAQVFTPTYLAPAGAGDVGVYLSDGPGSFAIEGIGRRAGTRADWGLRLGLASRDGVSALVGGELRSRLAGAAAPLDLALTGGAQGIIGTRSRLGLQAGLSAGGTIPVERTSISPYLHPRIGIVTGGGGAAEEGGDPSLVLLADVGVDVDPPGPLVIRIGIGMGGPWGVGLAWR